MIRQLVPIALTLALSSCTSSTHAPASAQPLRFSTQAEPAPSKASLATIDFAAHGLPEAGCFMLRDLSSGAEQVSNEQRCAQGRRPNSTFKIVNALIGADLGLLSGPDAIMKWDAERHPAQSWWFDGWAQDQSLRDAMRRSSVPVFQKLALEIGPARMAEYLEKLHYGNRDTSAGPDVFWLEGGMRITAKEQLDLVSKLVQDELPVSKRAQAIVREVLRKDPIAGFPHAGKTGSGGLETESNPPGQGAMIGWLVGWIELPRGPVAYAMWIEQPSYEALREQRLRIVEETLTDVAQRWH